jgi:hypothetical protein
MHLPLLLTSLAPVPPSVAANGQWPIFPPDLQHNRHIAFSNHLQHPPALNSTLKMEAARSCETQEQVFTARYKVCRDSSVGIATRYGWMAQGSNPGGGDISRTSSGRPWGPPRGTGSLSRG